jgi:hypothetical protein
MPQYMCWLLTSLSNIRQVLKKLSGTNTLAYFSAASATTKNVLQRRHQMLQRRVRSLRRLPDDGVGVRVLALDVLKKASQSFTGATTFRLKTLCITTLCITLLIKIT